MATIGYNDTIMATATSNGRVIANINASGFTSFADIINNVRRQVGMAAGMVSLKIRNFSRGWVQETVLYIAPIAVGTQLTLAI